MEDLNQLVLALKALGLDAQAGGWTLLTMVITVIGVVRVWRSDYAQRLCLFLVGKLTVAAPRVAAKLGWLVWARLPTVAKWAIPAGLSVLTAAAAYFDGRLSLGWAAVAAAIAIAGSWLGHYASKQVGHLVAPATNAVIGLLPEKVQRPTREIVSLAMPTPAPLVCDRCKKKIDGLELKTGTAGFYRVVTGPWSAFARPGEQVVCDACMFTDAGYRAAYPFPGDK